MPTGLLATITHQDEQIPFRPYSDPTKCPAEPTKWFNPLGVVGAECQNSIATSLTFDFSGQNVAIPANGRVAWTVAFNTSTKGYSPQGDVTPTCTLPPATATQPPVSKSSGAMKTSPSGWPAAGRDHHNAIGH